MICASTVKFSRSSIEPHLKAQHKMHLEDYDIQYGLPEGEPGEPALELEPVAVVDTSGPTLDARETTHEEGAAPHSSHELSPHAWLPSPPYQHAVGQINETTVSTERGK